jgi:hypothetical protein
MGRRSQNHGGDHHPLRDLPRRGQDRWRAHVAGGQSDRGDWQVRLDGVKGQALACCGLIQATAAEQPSCGRGATAHDLSHASALRNCPASATALVVWRGCASTAYSFSPRFAEHLTRTTRPLALPRTRLGKASRSRRRTNPGLCPASLVSPNVPSPTSPEARSDHPSLVSHASPAPPRRLSNSGVRILPCRLSGLQHRSRVTGQICGCLRLSETQG